VLLAVVIPVFNEAPTLRDLIARIDAVPPPSMPDGTAMGRLLVIVDDGSRDGSGAIIRDLDSRDDVLGVVSARNRGKGAAVAAGFAHALFAGADVVLIQDADLEYDPADHAAVVAPILVGAADAVIGNRFHNRSAWSLFRLQYAANRLITFLSNLATGHTLGDVECCYKAISRPVAERLEILEPRFGLEPEIVARLARMRLPGPDPRGRPVRLAQTPVSYAGRSRTEGKKIGWRDGVSALRCIVQYNLLDHSTPSAEEPTCPALESAPTAAMDT